MLFIADNLKVMRRVIKDLHKYLPTTIDIKLARIEEGSDVACLIEARELPSQPYFQDKGILIQGIPSCLLEYENPHLLSLNAYTSLLKAEQEDLIAEGDSNKSEGTLEKKAQEGEIYIGQEEIEEFLGKAKRGEFPRYLTSPR